MSWLLEVKGLSKTFGTARREVRALENINLGVDEGEFVTVIGPSGCGKSTLLRCVAGFERPSSGEVILSGRKVEAPAIDRLMVFQGFDRLFPWFTVLGNVTYALRAAGIGALEKERRAIAGRYLALVGLERFADLYPHELSGGMKSRAAIARALSVRPRVLLMDEPFGSLDALTRTVLQEELIRVWRDTGVTILFVTHNVEEAIALSDRVAVMESGPGRIRAVVPIRLERPRSPEQEDFAWVWEELHALLGFGSGLEKKRRRLVMTHVPWEEGVGAAGAVGAANVATGTT